MPISEKLAKLLRRKKLNQEQSMETKLKRCLSTSDLVFYAVSHMAGAGIYVLTGRLIRDIAGPSAGLSYLIAAISAVFTGLCYAEFATLIPKAGSSYTYTYVVIGELPAFLIGWTMLSDILISTATVAKGFSGTLNLLSGGVITNWTVETFGVLSNDSVFLDHSIDLVACGFLILLMFLTMAGAKISLSINSVFTISQIGCLLTVAVACFVFGDVKNWQEHGGFAPFGFTGIISGSGIAVYAFSGFEALAFASEEAKNPKVSIPIALFTSLSIITILYFIACMGLSYIVPRELLDYASPFVGVFVTHDLVTLKWIAAIGTLLATGATKIATMFVIPRIFYKMAEDGLVFTWLAYINEYSSVPVFSLLIGGSLSAVMALTFKVQSMADMTSLGILFCYCIIGLNLIILRYLRFQVDNCSNTIEEENGLLEQIQTDRSTSHEFSSLNIRDIFKNIACKFPLLKSRCLFKAILSVHIIAAILLSLIIDYVLSMKTWYSWCVFVLTLFCVISTFCVLCIYKPYTFPTSFNTPLMPLTPILTLLINLVLIVRLSLATWIRFFIWSAIGLIIYFCYGYRHSKVDSAENNNTYHLLKTADGFDNEIEVEDTFTK